MNHPAIRVLIDETHLEGVDDLLGEIRICAGGQCIEEQWVYLDSWLAALIEGSRAVQAQNRTSMEILEEPDHLFFDLTREGLEVRYKQQKAIFPSLSTFRECVAQSSREFLAKLRLLGIEPSSESLRLIEEYSAQ